jgi:hypothetical protein
MECTACYFLKARERVLLYVHFILLSKLLPLIMLLLLLLQLLLSTHRAEAPFDVTAFTRVAFLSAHITTKLNIVHIS